MNTASNPTKPPITVIVLTYNSANTIAACLDSLCSQTIKSFSLMIVDDNSNDQTLQIVDDYSQAKKLDITVLTNGAHNIPRGRNIGLRSVKRGIAAFIDSDDTAHQDWIETILNTFTAKPNLAMISGEQVTSYRTNFARAIACNDQTMRNLFTRDSLLFCTCNCAINRDVLTNQYFDENFLNGEDLEFVSRIEKEHPWGYIKELKVNHTTRDTTGKYIKQFYMYGKWKVFYYYKTSTFGIIDILPLVIGFACLAVSIFNIYLIISLLLLPTLQTLAAVYTKQFKVSLLPLMFWAWCIKNISWSIGFFAASFSILTNSKTRSQISKKVM